MPTAPGLEDDVARAVALLRAGELVAFPTETVYGLGADASNPAAVAKIFAAKGRPADHPLIVHLPSAEALDAWAREVPEAARKLAAAFWPGPLTLILKRQPHVPDAVTGGQDTVGLRVPNHPLALALLRAFNGGIAAPSANRYGRISPTSAAHVIAELGAAVPLVLDGGPCTVGIEIVDLSGGEPRVLRPGAITAADIARVLGETLPARTTESDAPRVAGSHAAHYAPRTALRIVAGTELPDAITVELAAGLRIVVLAHAAKPVVARNLTWHAAPADAVAYAHDLYTTLRALDEAAHDLLLVEAPPATSAWLAVADRLQRAACGSGEDDET
ncbi:MAG: L-threonylcarbamoyladenylate synthase [Proteobacteria bacterium]|nr:L-threonylcarbamoyladenylate synthase [Pseudomonadota bacterium]